MGETTDRAEEPGVPGADGAAGGGPRVAVLGAGHSAQTAARDLAALTASGSAAASWWTARPQARRDSRLRVALWLTEGGSENDRVEADRVVSLTGYGNDYTLCRRLQVQECCATCGPPGLAAELLASDATDSLDQESHGVEALENPEPDFFLPGEKSCGRRSTFSMTVGREQVDEVFGDLDERTAAAG